jgi:hypothetical protein
MAYISFISLIYNYTVIVIEKFKKLVSEILLSNVMKRDIAQCLAASMAVFVPIRLFKYSLIALTKLFKHITLKLK